jgi:hypothetical protein
MNLIEIEGPAEILRGLLDVEGLSLSTRSATEISPNRFVVSGTATDAAIATVQSRGATVRTIMDNAQYDAHVNRVFSQIARDDTGVT